MRSSAVTAPCEAQMGTIQMALPALQLPADLTKEFKILSALIFHKQKTAFEALDGILGDKLDQYLLSKGFVVLGYQENGMRHVTNSKRPIKTPADPLRGSRSVRWKTPMHIAFFKELG